MVLQNSRPTLGVYDFVNAFPLLQFSRERLQEVAKDITTLPRTEGLEAHAQCFIEVRFEKQLYGWERIKRGFLNDKRIYGENKSVSYGNS